jgi:hypothetical protein
LLQFFLTVSVSDWMPWIVVSDPAMAVEAKRNAVIEGIIAAIHFLNDMMAFDQSMYVLFAQAASSLACQKGSFSDLFRNGINSILLVHPKIIKAKLADMQAAGIADLVLYVVVPVGTPIMSLI